MHSYTVYVVDDEAVARTGMIRVLEQDFTVRGFATAEEALSAIKESVPDVVLLDIGLPGMSGIDALREIKRTAPDIIAIMITAYEDIAMVVTAMRLGAYDYIVKPIHMDGLMITIGNALETIRLRKEVQQLQKQYLEENIPCFIGRSASIQSVMEFVERVAQSPDTPVLICGETGTGKELIASAIHYKSPNFKGPFVTLNCAAIPRELLESELFGYERGAFSGARDSGKRGLVEQAAGGTLFLDEVGDLSSDAQAKLLRFLEAGEYYRVGGTQKLHVTTRVISATNRDLENMIEQGTFRQDLYYRLAVIKVDIPSLSKRPEDILPIARYFLVQFSTKFGKQFTGITDEAEQLLLSHEWRGNVRELRNVIERGVLTGRGPLLSAADISFLPRTSRRQAPGKTFIELPDIGMAGFRLDSVLEEVERRYFEEALKRCNGNESEAARMLGLNYYTFRHRRKKLL